MKKRIVRLSLALVIGLALVVALNWSLVKQIATFGPTILPHFGPAPKDEAEARLQDIEYLARLLDVDAPHLYPLMFGTVFLLNTFLALDGYREARMISAGV